MKKSYRHVLVFSGGIDSSTVAWLLKDDPDSTLLFHLNQGWKKHEKQAAKLSQVLGMDMHTFDVRPITSMLRAPGSGYLPGYRSISYFLALALADSKDAPFIYSGEVSLPFNAESPDEDPEVVAWRRIMGVGRTAYTGMDGTLFNRMKLAAWHGQGAYRNPNAFTLIDPVAGMSKAQIIKLATRLEVPLAETISCRNKRLDLIPGNTNHCGVCQCCISRRAGFKLAKLNDPTRYLTKRAIPREWLSSKPRNHRSRSSHQTR